MVEITAIRQIKEKVSFSVDDRIYGEDEMVYKIANVILDDRLSSLIHTIYSNDYDPVSWSVEEINEAFKKADKILAL